MQKIVLKIIGFYLNITAPLFPKLNREQAFNLLCKVRRFTISDHGEKFIGSGNTQYINLADNKVALHSWGKGAKTIFFVHGWMSYTYRWKVYIDNLDFDEYTIYAIDAPAHGFSEGNVLNIETYREAVAKSITIIGNVEVMICHSLGSLVGAYAYLENNKISVNNFVIMGAPKNIFTLFDYFKQALGVSTKVLENLKSKADDVLKVDLEKISMQNFFSSAEAPILVIHEKTDAVTPFSAIKEAVCAANKNIETLYTQGQDHNLKEKETIYRVLEFISEKTKQTEKEKSICI